MSLASEWLQASVGNAWRAAARNAALVLLMLAVLPAARADDIHVLAIPGAVTAVASVGCVETVTQPKLGTVETAKSSPSKTWLMFNSPAQQRDDQVFTVGAGTTQKADGAGCESVSNRTYVVSFDALPTVSNDAIAKSFKILMAAFVLAVLLESAFTLVFNWRLFNAFFVGKAVRTPIMFAGSLLFVQQAKFDLMATLLDAYYPRSGDTASNWLTLALTAMILAGGSVGVNRILVALRFRKEVREESKAPELSSTEAWISVNVDSAVRGAVMRVDVTPITSIQLDTVPATVGVIGGPKPSFFEVLTGSPSRIPRSGGITVSTAKIYTITVFDVAAGILYDVTGRKLDPGDIANPLRFAPRALVDFTVKVPKPPPV